MSGVGSGVIEMRVHRGGAFRVLYVAKFAEAVYALHAFAKKSRKTRHADVAVARRRLAELLAWRRSQGPGR